MLLLIGGELLELNRKMEHQISIGKLERLILKALLLFPKLTLKELSAELNLVSNPHGSLKNLENKGLIEVDRSKYHTNQYHLTQFGREISNSLF